MAPEAEKPPTPSRRRCGLSPRTWAVVSILFVLLAVDVSRPPAAQLSAAVLLWSIDLYQATASPLLAAGGAKCRFEPSCSHYGEEAIRKYGTLKGVGLTARRILRCGPWTPAGTLDEP
ncbi:MAG: membrane protein insertion efficiency factor YidD [Acidobacteria bacterium]|nr:membrane protein insertion efficiency factor YidD [Acidobacteriota bacterium]